MVSLSMDRSVIHAPAKNEDDPNQKNNPTETYVLANNNIPQPKALPEPIPLV